MQAEDSGDSVTFLFESPTQERHSDFELKLMDIDSEQCAPTLHRQCCMFQFNTAAGDFFLSVEP
jgi:hypothetical protein